MQIYKTHTAPMPYHPQSVGWISEDAESNHSSMLATTVDEPGGE